MKNTMTTKQIIEFHSDKSLVDGYSWINKSKMDKQWLSKEFVDKCIKDLIMEAALHKADNVAALIYLDALKQKLEEQ